MTKRLLALLLAAGITVTLAACGGNKTADTSSTGDTATASTVVDDASQVDDVVSVESKDEETKDETSEPTQTQPSQPTTTTPGNQTQTQTPSTQTQTPQANTDRVTGGSDNAKPQTGGSGVTNQSGKTNITAAVANLKVKEGKSVTEGLDFKGKTFTMAITEEGQYNTASFKRTIAAFQTEYNCKIKTITLKFDGYNQQIAQLLAAGNAPEIAYCHGNFFPDCAIDGLYNTLNDVLTTGDLMDNNNPTAGGIDLAKTSYFVYKGKIYGTCNYSSCFPYVIYYNKKQMTDKGQKDPRTLAANGQWTFDYIKKMGRQLTQGDVYYCSNSFMGRGVPLAFGAPIVTVTNGVYKENVSSAGYIEAMEFMKSICTGANAIVEPRDAAHAYNSYETLLKGGVYLWTEETSKYLDISKDVKTSSAFNRKKENIGVTTMPLGSTNTQKAYPTGWLTAVCSGKGTDPRVALAWDVFRSGYKDPVRDTNAFSAADQAFVDGLLKGNIACEVGKFSTSSETTLTLTEGGIIQKIVRGADVTQCVNEIKGQMTQCINTTLNKKAK